MKEGAAEQKFLIRRAGLEDVPVIAWHRARMFQDMGEIPETTFDEMLKEARAWTERALATDEYVGWLGMPKNKPQVIAGGAGVQLRQVPPHPCRPARNGTLAKGRHAVVLNVFTEPEWRRRGLAFLLMEEIVRWARTEQLDQLVLHASRDGQALYEQMGFVATNEMRFDGELNAPPGATKKKGIIKMNKLIFTEEAPNPIGAYSQGIRTGSTLYCAGQIPLDPKTGQVVSGGMAEQARRVLDNLFAVLRANELAAEHVVKTTVFISDMADYPAMNEVYGTYFPDRAPARTTVEVSGLPRGVRIEIDAIAVAPEEG